MQNKVFRIWPHNSKRGGVTLDTPLLERALELPYTRVYNNINSILERNLVLIIPRAYINNYIMYVRYYYKYNRL